MRTTLVVLLLILVGTVAFCNPSKAAQFDMQELIHPHRVMPRIVVINESQSDLSEALYRKMLKAFARAGWIADSKHIALKDEQYVDRRTECEAAVSQLGEKMLGLWIQLECGPADTYGNGIWVKHTLNILTSESIIEDAEKVPDIAVDLYEKYRRLKQNEEWNTATTPSKPSMATP
jgi:hypothetical protein